MSKRSRRHEQEPAQPAEEQAMEQAQEAQPQEETAAADPAPQAPAGQPAPAAAAPLFPEPEQKPREPRGENEIQHDFRMAKFTGTIEKVVEDWKDDRNYKKATSAARTNRAAFSSNRRPTSSATWWSRCAKSAGRSSPNAGANPGTPARETPEAWPWS